MPVNDEIPRPPRHVAGGDVPAIALAGDVYLLLVTGEDTGGAYCLSEAIVSPGGGPPPHIHTREEEGFHVLEGSFTFQLGDRAVRLGPGETANVSRGTLHTFRGDSPGPNRMLIWNVPAGLDRFFRMAGTEVEGRDSAPIPITPEEIGRMIALAPEFGIEFPPPPSESS